MEKSLREQVSSTFRNVLKLAPCTSLGYSVMVVFIPDSINYRYVLGYNFCSFTSKNFLHELVFFLQLLLKGAGERGAKRIRVHILTDGRDVLDGSSVGFVETLEKDLEALRQKGVDARIASGGGRMYVTMDRYEVRNISSMHHSHIAV